MVTTLDDFLKPGGNRDVVLCTYCSRTKDDQYTEGFPRNLYTSGRIKSFFKHAPEEYKRPLLIVWLPRPCEATKWEEFLDKMKVDWIKITKIKGVDFDSLIQSLDINRWRI